MFSLLRMSQLLILFFVGSVTLWYCITPYIINPHPRIVTDILTKSKLSPQGGLNADSLVQIENWTKWRLYVNTSEGKSHVVYGYSKTSLPIRDKASLNMEWRSEYVISLSVDKSSHEIHLSDALPTESKSGIYKHFEVTIIPEQRAVKIVPRFLFGLSFDVIENLYGTNVSDFPIIGVFSDSPKFDRVIIQAYMNIVVLSVVFLLYANNPPDQVMAKTKTS